MRLRRLPYEMHEPDEPLSRDEKSSLRPLAADVRSPLGTPMRSGWPLFVVGVVCGVAGFASVKAWTRHNHSWNLGPPEAQTLAAAPIERCPPPAAPPAVQPPSSCPSLAAAGAPEASARAGGGNAIERSVKRKKAGKKKPSAFAAAMNVPEQPPPALSVFEPPEPPPEEQAAHELSDSLR